MNTHDYLVTDALSMAILAAKIRWPGWRLPPKHSPKCALEWVADASRWAREAAEKDEIATERHLPDPARSFLALGRVARKFGAVR